MRPEDELIDVAAAAARHRCSVQAIRRRMWQGDLPSRTEKVVGSDGRRVFKTLIRVGDLNDAFGWTAHEEHVRRIREAAVPLSDEQNADIRKVFLDHIRDRGPVEGDPGAVDRQRRQRVCNRSRYTGAPLDGPCIQSSPRLDALGPIWAPVAG